MWGSGAQLGQPRLAKLQRPVLNSVCDHSPSLPKASHAAKHRNRCDTQHLRPFWTSTQITTNKPCSEETGPSNFKSPTNEMGRGTSRVSSSAQPLPWDPNPSRASQPLQALRFLSLHMSPPPLPRCHPRTALPTVPCNMLARVQVTPVEQWHCSASGVGWRLGLCNPSTQSQLVCSIQY